MSDQVRFELAGRVAILRFDDGKANAVSHEAVAALGAALERAAREAGAAVLIGRPGRFSAGFDLSVMNAGPDAARGLVLAGGELLLRIVESPVPVIAACSGHALAMGALLLLAADVRIGASGAFRIGLNEVAIGLPLPAFAVELARERLSRRALGRATALAELCDPESAVATGFLDRVVAAERLEAEAVALAETIAALPAAAYRITKQKLRGPLVARIRATLHQDLAGWGSV
jgi:enoyl-CoA hydratase